jgi:hypothetical protein
MVWYRLANCEERREKDSLYRIYAANSFLVATVAGGVKQQQRRCITTPPTSAPVIVILASLSRWLLGLKIETGDEN